MIREEALKSFEEENKDFEKTFERYGYQMSPEEVSAVKEAIERNKVAISALSIKGEYIKKDEIINHLTELGWISDEPFNEVSIPKEVFDEVPTYSFPDSENKGEFDGMTNGEVIKALFSNADYCGGAHFMHITNVNSIGEVSFPWEWWNAPYKEESEDEE